MQDSPQVNTAVDAVRCLYLAKVAERSHAKRGNEWSEAWERVDERTSGRVDGW